MEHRKLDGSRKKCLLLACFFVDKKKKNTSQSVNDISWVTFGTSCRAGDSFSASHLSCASITRPSFFSKKNFSGCAVAHDKSIISNVTGLKGQKKMQELWQPYS